MSAIQRKGDVPALNGLFYSRLIEVGMDRTKQALKSELEAICLNGNLANLG
jgi:hypothetical protein